MVYERILPAIFADRPNRFVAHVELDGREEVCHVKNTGRCRELLVPGAKIYVQKAKDSGSKRRTAYDLISVYKGDRLVNIDSQIPNSVVEEWIRAGNLLNGLTLLKREVTFRSSRFDLYGEYKDHRKAFIEVKGVTLEREGVAAFPDASTERGVRHVEELCRCIEAGYEAYLIFVIQMKGVRELQPNWETHPAFGEALIRARRAGVQILAYDCQVTPESICLDLPVTVNLDQ